MVVEKNETALEPARRSALHDKDTNKVVVDPSLVEIGGKDLEDDEFKKNVVAGSKRTSVFNRSKEANNMRDEN